MLARTRHHIVLVGSVLVENCDTVTVWVRISGAGKEFESSICMV